MSTFHPGARGTSSRSLTDPPVRLDKVPQINLLFWGITALTAGMGQAASDWLIGTGNGLPGLGLGGALGIEAGLFAIALALQFTVHRYVPPVYWLAVIAVSVFGTVVADVMHFLIGIPLWASPSICALVLAVNFLLWYRAERSLSIHSIRTRRREVSYWVTVLFIFALGTSVVDLMTMVWNVGRLASGVIFLVLILVAAGLSIRFRRATVLLLWPAYIITRPMSGSFSDWLIDGLGLGAGTVTLAASVLIAVLVGYSTVADRTSRRPGTPQDVVVRS
jgi:uncharacterized membrane-anchored protein